MIPCEGGGGWTGKRLPGRQAALLNPRWRLSREPSSPLILWAEKGAPEPPNKMAEGEQLRAGRRKRQIKDLLLSIRSSLPLFFSPLSRLSPSRALPAFSFTWQWHLFTCRPCNYLTSLPHQLSGVFNPAIIMHWASLRRIFALVAFVLARSLSFVVSLFVTTFWTFADAPAWIFNHIRNKEGAGILPLCLPPAPSFPVDLHRQPWHLYLP